MAHDVFISYSSLDRQAADTICRDLERRGMVCWMAPRDIVPGVPWAESIVDALEASTVMVLVYSASANVSVQIHREVERAVHKNVPVIPIRIEDAVPTRTMEYFISATHWFEATQPPLESHLDRFASGVAALLARHKRTAAPPAPAHPAPAHPAPAHAAPAHPAPGAPAHSAPGAPAAPAAPAPSAPVAPAPVAPAPVAPAPVAPAPVAPAPVAPAPSAPPALSAPSAPSSDHAMPSVLGNYEVGEFLGNARYGSVVHVGTHRLLGNQVALRIFRAPEKDRGAAVRERFLREARALQVQHPNIVHVRDFGEIGDILYIVTDLLAGCSLEQLITAEGPLALEKLRQFIGELAGATEAVHRAKGLISGLRPEMIRVIREAGTERIAISTAGVHAAQELMAVMNDAALRGQAAANELSYIAPELLMGKTADVRADLFTLGVLAYQMASAKVPFQGHTFPEVMGAMLMTRPTPLPEVRPDLPAPAGEAVMRCLASDPQQRFESAAAFLEAWNAALT